MKQSFGLLFILLILTVILCLPYLFYRVVTDTGDWLNSLDSFALYSSKILAETIVLIYAIRRLKRNEPYHLKSEISFNPSTSWIWAVLCAVGLIFLLEPLEALIPSSSLLQVHFSNLASVKPVSMVYIVFISPILNELLFRGIILRGLLQNIRPASALLLSSALFGLYHFTLLQLFMGFILSMFFGFVYCQTRSLGLTILLHSLNNAAAYIIIIFSGKIGTFEQQINNTPVYLLIYLLAAMLVSVSLLQLYKIRDLQK